MLRRSEAWRVATITPSAPPWRNDTPRFLRDSWESRDGTGTTSAVGASQADGTAGAWLPDLSGEACKDSQAASVHWQGHLMHHQYQVDNAELS